jgi:parvulin-like peptidyl-prolyl isomerase
MKSVCLCLATGVLAGSPILVQGETVDRIVAVVHDSVITSGDVDVSTDLAFLRLKYSGQPDTFLKEVDRVQKENLDELVKRQLILHEFSSSGYSLPESALDEMVEAEIHSVYADRRTWAKTLQAQGLSFEKWRQGVRDRYILQALRSKNISQEIIISPHKMEEYYNKHRDEYKVEEKVKLRRISLAPATDPAAPLAEKMAEEILGKLKEGAPFAEMVALYSQTKQEGEWYDWSALVPPLADVAASLQVGQCSKVMSRSVGENDYWICQYENGRPVLGRHYVLDPVSKKEAQAEERRFGSASSATNLPPPQEYFLLLLEDKSRAHFTPLSEVRPKIEEELRLKETSDLERDWIEKLRKKTFVRIFPGG